jgi:hypothetical protein
VRLGREPFGGDVRERAEARRDPLAPVLLPDDLGAAGDGVAEDTSDVLPPAATVRVGELDLVPPLTSRVEPRVNARVLLDPNAAGPGLGFARIGTSVPDAGGGAVHAAPARLVRTPRVYGATGVFGDARQSNVAAIQAISGAYPTPSGAAAATKRSTAWRSILAGLFGLRAISSLREGLLRSYLELKGRRRDALMFSLMANDP